MSALPKDTVAAHASTRFEYCPANRTLRAIAVVEATDDAPPSLDALCGLADRLNAVTADDARVLRGDGRFEADLCRRELLLIRELDIRELSFDELVAAVARLGRVAARWGRMRPAQAVSDVIARLAWLTDGRAP